MPQAIERLLATPKIRPRLPRMMPEASGIPSSLRRPLPASPNDIGGKDLQAAQVSPPRPCPGLEPGPFQARSLKRSRVKPGTSLESPGVVSGHALARIVGLAVAPLAHQRLELAILTVGQDDADAGEEIALALLAGEALALEAEGSSRIGARRDRQLDRAVEGGDAHLAAEHGFIERDRQVEPQVQAIGLK